MTLAISKELELLAGCGFYIKLTLMGSPEALTGVGFLQLGFMLDLEDKEGK